MFHSIGERTGIIFTVLHAFGTDNVSAIGYYKGTLWAATAKTVEGVAGEDVAAGTGLKYTTDNGLTWNSVPQPVDNE